jgi:hypothetical protein
VLRRGLVVGAVVFGLVAVALVLFPFEAETGSGAVASRTCIPVVEALRSGPARPSADDLNLVLSTGVPTPAQAHDPQYRARAAAIAKSPAAARVYAWDDWTLGAGACVTRSRHRVAKAEAALGVAVVLGVGAVVASRLGRPETLLVR